MTMFKTLAAAACAVATCLAGCASSRDARGPEGRAVSPHQAPILHIVLVRLRDPLDTAEAARDSLDAAAAIPSVSSAFCGLHLDTGRETVVRDYDFCLTLGFQTVADYDAYLVHPAHQALLQKWRDRTEWLRIYDAQDIRPASTFSTSASSSVTGSS